MIDYKASQTTDRQLRDSDQNKTGSEVEKKEQYTSSSFYELFTHTVNVTLQKQ